MPIATTLLTHAETWLGRLDYLFKPGTVVLGAAAAFLCYRWRSKGETPILVCNDGFREFLERRCPAVKERYCPTPWCWGGRLQTLVRVVIKSSPHVTYRNELIKTLDGGQISLDWVDNSESIHYPNSTTRPTVLILPGLTGNSSQTYVLHAVSQATRHGYRVVVFNNRGFGGEELLTPVTFCAANTSDLEHVVSHIKQQLPQTPLMAAGVSLGGILLLNYLARMGRKSGLLAAFTVSVSWNTVESCASLEKPLNKILFNYHLASNLCQAITRHRKVLEPVIDVDYILKSRTIREFDERYTSVMFGYKTCKDYYHDASPFYKLPSTTIPVLCLNAADDPFSPEHTIPVESARRLPNVALVITARGGHVGFLEGFFPQGESYMDRLFGQFIWAVFEHGKDLAEMCITKN
ncbi:phospholipase ABHD3-like [Polypterus senegalus]|uniref:phospholipase ABHD3-like n=1 Tax=Polypterus senegalus TaxID=55291 RepID=UPI00196440A4|nr:phospholipase ABHD3-like [Polypterus senegalus]XP_039604382.1 phospholipase ABHD3-like [Polypterus senegalus]